MDLYELPIDTPGTHLLATGFAMGKVMFCDVEARLVDASLGRGICGTGLPGVLEKRFEVRKLGTEEVFVNVDWEVRRAKMNVDASVPAAKMLGGCSDISRRGNSYLEALLGAAKLESSIGGLEDKGLQKRMVSSSSRGDCGGVLNAIGARW